jgi:hypothetical protein
MHIKRSYQAHIVWVAPSYIFTIKYPALFTFVVLHPGSPYRHLNYGYATYTRMDRLFVMNIPFTSDIPS